MSIRQLIHAVAGCFGIGLLLFPMPGAQTAPPRQPALALRSDTRLVQLSVVVRDQKGQPVKDLRESDFTVEDDGKRQQIRFFSIESQPAAGKGTVPVPPGVFTNRRVAHADSTGGITVILLDGINTRWGDQELARKNVLEYLSQIQPRDRVALYTLGKELKVLQDFTEAPAELVRSLAAYRGEHTPDLEASSAGMTIRAGIVTGGIAALIGEEANYYKRTRVSMTLTALEAIAKYLAGVPGRKNLLWVSGGFPLAIGTFANDDGYEELGGDPRYSARLPTRGAYTPGLGNRNTTVTLTFGKEFEALMRLLNAADVAVYPVDARGLTTSRLAVNNISTMKDLARGTGGRAYYNRNDLMNSIREAIQDSVASYTLAYYPSEKKPDGRFRKIRVKVNRPGLSARYRPGYYDSNIVPSDEKAKTAATREAVWSPLDATAVTIDAQVDLPNSVSPDALVLRLKVDPNNLMLEQRDGHWVGQIDLALVQTDEKGTEYAVRVQTVPLNLAQDAYEAVIKNGLILSKTIQRNAAATALRVVVRDAASGSLGRVIIPFQKR